MFHEFWISILLTTILLSIKKNILPPVASRVVHMAIDKCFLMRTLLKALHDSIFSIKEVCEKEGFQFGDEILF